MTMTPPLVANTAEYPANGTRPLAERGRADALPAIFTGPLESLPRPACGDSSVDGLRFTFRELAEPSVMAALQEAFAPAYPDGDRRAVASMWSKWLFNAVLPTVVGLLLTRARAWVGDDSSVGIVLDRAGRPERFWIAVHGDVTATVPIATGLERLAHERLAPTIEALTTVSGASRNVFWSNAGNSLEYLVGEMARHPAITPAVLEQAYAFLERRRLTDGRRNPLFRPVRYQPAAGAGAAVRRQRRVCCIRYLLPELSYCANCPLACRQPAGERGGERGGRRALERPTRQEAT